MAWPGPRAPRALARALAEGLGQGQGNGQGPQPVPYSAMAMARTLAKATAQGTNQDFGQQGNPRRIDEDLGQGNALAIPAPGQCLGCCAPPLSPGHFRQLKDFMQDISALGKDPRD